MTARLTLSLLAFFAAITVSAQTIRIVDAKGRGIAGVSVLIGSAPNVPFQGNQVVTDKSGAIVAPPQWTSPLPVTLEGPGLVRTTHLDVSPNANQLTISENDGEEHVELKGALTDYGPIRTDGKVDVGVFMPALPADQLFYFDVSWLVSPEADIIKVFGQDVALPSNIVLPKQTENYVFPITIDKPNFRMFVRKPGPYKFLAIHGQFPLQRMVDGIRAGQPPYEMINNITLLKSGTTDLNVQGPMSGLQVPVSGMNFSDSITVQAPSMNADDVVMTVAFSDLDGNGSLIPSDIKRLHSNQPQVLKTPANRSNVMAISAWMKQQGKKSVQFLPEPTSPEELLQLPDDLLYRPFQTPAGQTPSLNYQQVSFAYHSQASTVPRFLALVSPPQIDRDRIRLSPPAALAGVTPVATLVLYSSLAYSDGPGNTKVEQRTRRWEIWAPGWATEVALPAMPAVPGRNNEKWRWEVLYLGKDSSGVAIKSFGKQFTHVTRNAKDL